jgi:DNA replication and repair protein RecF
MQIKKLTLDNFRNYEHEEFVFLPNLNVLFGRNAQGKTNCAEAIFYLCTGSSLRIKHEKQLIRTGAEYAHIAAVTENSYGEVKIEATIGENMREIKINGNKITKNADILGQVNSIFFSPGELRLIQDGPDERRRFLNLSISQLSKGYYTALLRYNKILEQRNTLLKNRDVSLVMETLPVWDVQLCRYAAKIAQARKEYVAELSPLASEVHSYLTDGAEALSVCMDRAYGETEEETEKKLLSEMAASYERDIRLGFTGTGPHRDDLKIVIGDKDARGYASQGQARTAALSLKLAELEIFKKRAGEYPILILDDVMSELDLPRRKKLVGKLQGVQTIITCTHAERVLYGKDCNKIKIAGGKIIP